MTNKLFFSRYFTSSEVNEGRPTFSKKAFIQNLIFNDQLVHVSGRFTEIPHLIDLFGLEGLIDLLKSKHLIIHADAFSVAQAGQTMVLGRNQKRGVLPQNSYWFTT